MKQHIVHIHFPGPRPPFYRVAEHLWGAGCDVDSDGDSIAPEDRDWTELTLRLRNSPDQRLDIDPISHEPLVLAVRSPQQALCQAAAEFLVSVCGGVLRRA